MTIEQVFEKRDEILRIAAKHRARNICIFGSVARGDANPESDIDLLVEVGPTTSSRFPAGLILDLEKLLGRPVEVVTDRGLSPYLRDRVLSGAIPL